MKETVSTLMDNELDNEDVAQAVQAIKADPTLKSAWDEYHLIGEALRSGQVSHAATSVAQRVSEKLRDEAPIVVLPRPKEARVKALGAVALVACLSVIAVVSWPHFTNRDGLAPYLSTAEPAAVSSQPVSLDSEEAPYLLAHQDMTTNGFYSLSYHHRGAVN